MGNSIQIVNGTIVNPADNKEGTGDILIKNGRIERIDFKERTFDPTKTKEIEAKEKEDSTDNETEVIDASGMYVFPGLVDAHTHFRDPGFTHKEDILSGAKAAAAGGYTAVVLMCNTKPVVDNVETFRYVVKKGEETAIHVYSCGSVSIGLKGEQLTDMRSLKEEGAVGFTDDGIPLMNEDFLTKAMEECARIGLPISLHEEDKTLIANNGINRGKASEYYGIGGSPAEAEISLIKRDLPIALKTGAVLDVQHVSAKESVELIREAVLKQGEDRRIHAEATPHHFSLTEEAVIEYGANAKCNPPLRTEEDRQAIIEGLRDNTIDLIATDHAPHTAEEKNVKILES